MALYDLLAIGLVEKDNNGDSLYVWSYPSVTSDLQEKFLQRSNMATDSSPCIQFLYSQTSHLWYYIFTNQVQQPCQNLAKVRFVSLILITKDFQPEKYKALCELLLMSYLKSGDPIEILKLYLSVITKGSCASGNNSSFSVSDFSQRQAYAKADLRSVIESFAVETILIYTALMLKKHVVVYHPNIEELLHFMRSLPGLVWHRQDWSIVIPFITLDNQEVNLDLKGRSSYVAGFTDASIQNRTDLYDLMINLQSCEITVAPSAKESLALGKLHKEIAMFMVQCAGDVQLSNQQVIKEISDKTKELLNNIKAFSVPDEETGKPYITMELLQSRKMPKTTENFLYSLSVCEGMVKL
ncbi:Protein FAM45A,Putative protein FAM45B [Acanthosepion pharaonis]|uniref:UDENN domain-containing protein n=1 Tax=Acanthosepion pharaonis TaxID=158019 RepID=A0A812BG00_ACAPH|nr:Protein FAM45A,Putative protein FAM45B [Sepia pharaonis]